MKKSIKKSILTLCLVITVFVCNVSTCFATGTCPNPNSPDGYHHYTGQKIVGGNVTHSSHEAMIGYDQYHNPVYVTCYMTQVTDYFVYVCYHCGEENPEGTGGQIVHPTQHSISHP